MTRAALPILCILLLTASCAETTAGRATPAAAPGRPQQVTIKASSFAFVPNQVTVEVGQPVQVTVSNVSGSEHNITILDRRRQIIVDRTVPPGSTRTVCFTPAGPGRYEFYCGQFGHSTLGMTGEFVASGGS